MQFILMILAGIVLIVLGIIGGVWNLITSLF